jgi:CSLREA domain-containing protein
MAQTSNPNDRQRQIAREKMAFRYSNALARHDFSVVAEICEAASSDSILAEMIREIDEVYAAELGSPIQAQPGQVQSVQTEHTSSKNGVNGYMARSQKPSAKPSPPRVALTPRGSTPGGRPRSVFGASLAVLMILTILFGIVLIALSQKQTDQTTTVTPQPGAQSTTLATVSPTKAPILQLAQTPAVTPTFIVNLLGDTDTGCPANCTLRAAIASAKDGAVIGFAPNLKGVIKLGSILTVTRSISIVGPGLSLIAIDGGEETGLFDISGAEVTISGLTLQNGLADAGGAIHNASKTVLTLTNCLISKNASNGFAGGILNEGALIIDKVTFHDNTASAEGGGIVSNGNSKLTILNSTFDENAASTLGGAIASSENATIEIVNSTLADNSAGTSGGAIVVTGGSLTIANSTISTNSAGSTGGGVFVSQAKTFALKSTIIADNTSGVSSPDIVGTVTSNGFNLIGDAHGTSGLLVSDQRNVEAKLGALMPNQPGQTATMALQTNSPGRLEKAAQTAQRPISAARNVRSRAMWALMKRPLEEVLTIDVVDLPDI